MSRAVTVVRVEGKVAHKVTAIILFPTGREPWRVPFKVHALLGGLSTQTAAR